jgi:hypothetical protein
MDVLLAHRLAELPARSRRRCRWLVKAVSLAIFAGWTGVTAACGGVGSQRREVVADYASYVAGLVEQFKSSQGRCPRGLPELVEAGLIRYVPFDPWHHDLLMVCQDDWVQVCSRGWDADSPDDDICARPGTLQPPPRRPGG